MKELKFRITFTEDLLGSSSNDPHLHENYIASKAPDAWSTAEEVEALGIDAVVENGKTIFPKDTDGTPIFWDYQIKGYFKESCKALSKVPGNSRLTCGSSPRPAGSGSRRPASGTTCRDLSGPPRRWANASHWRTARRSAPELPSSLPCGCSLTRMPTLSGSGLTTEHSTAWASGATPVTADPLYIVGPIPNDIHDIAGG
ncbi:hypothetical protein, partial [Ralstonia pseudosolanacearum]|uniref:hypothetical protein n=1 Tax=Ralstonia pseudosolanacearum TaxID=1310165 RepID=UPI003CF335B2